MGKKKPTSLDELGTDSATAAKNEAVNKQKAADQAKAAAEKEAAEAKAAEELAVKEAAEAKAAEEAAEQAEKEAADAEVAAAQEAAEERAAAAEERALAAEERAAEAEAAADKAEKELADDLKKFKPKVDVDLNAAGKNPKADYIDIIIDEVDNMPNYEVVGVNGKIYQIKRGEKTAVPPAVVAVLENAVATRSVQHTDPSTGELITVARDYSAIPWRKA